MSPELPRRRRRKAADEEPEKKGSAAEATTEEAPETAEKPEQPEAKQSKRTKAPAKAEAESSAAGDAEAKPARRARSSAKAAKPDTKEIEAEAKDEQAEAKDEQAEEAPAAEAKPAARTRRSAKAKEEEAPAKATKPAAARPSPRPGARVSVSARARYVRTSPRKARMVCGHIRGKSVHEARAILQFTPRSVARDWSKLLESAIANAEHNHELLADDLVVREAFADAGPTIKRFRPRAMGRATPIRKRTSHLTITLGTGR